MGPLVADPDICHPGQHAVPDEHAPLMSIMMSDAVQDDATEVGVHLAVCIAATSIQSLMCWPSCTLYLRSAHGQAASIDFCRCQDLQPEPEHMRLLACIGICIRNLSAWDRAEMELVLAGIPDSNPKWHQQEARPRQQITKSPPPEASMAR